MPGSEFLDIRKLNLFSQMADEAFTSLMRGAYVQNFPAQIELITEGEPSDFLHVDFRIGRPVLDLERA